jgi:hypothetical protein
VLLLHGFTGTRDEGTVFDADGNELHTMYGHTADALADAGSPRCASTSAARARASSR